MLLAVLGLYVVLMLATQWRHEPWFDEAQAWLIARDVGWWEIISQSARYEGTPPLWHLLLAIPAKLGLPYGSIHVISGAVAIATVALVLWKSPFPLWLRVVFPFTFFPFYQFAVVARSYCLLMLALVLAACLYRERQRRPWLWLAVLFFMGLTSVHGFLVAGWLFLDGRWEAWKSSRASAASKLREAALPFGIFVLYGLGIVWMLVPPADLAFPDPAHPASGWRFNPGNLNHLRYAFSGSVPLALVVIAGSLLWFVRRRKFWLYLSPTATILFVCVFKHAAAWHQGVLFLFWFFCMWVAFPRAEERNDPSGKSPRKWDYALGCALLGVVLLTHLYWGLQAVRLEWALHYSSAPQAAQYLRDHPEVRKDLAGTMFMCVAVNPYFEENVFSNLDPKDRGHFHWATDTYLRFTPEAIARERPKHVLFGRKFIHLPSELPVDGYELVEEFPGHLIWKDGILEEDTLLLYRRVD